MRRHHRIDLCGDVGALQSTWRLDPFRELLVSLRPSQPLAHKAMELPRIRVEVAHGLGEHLFLRPLREPLGLEAEQTKEAALGSEGQAELRRLGRERRRVV